MKVLELGRVPLSSEDIVFRQSRSNVLLRFLIGIAIFIAFGLSWGLGMGNILDRGRITFMEICIAFALIALAGFFLSTLGRRHWLIRYSREGLFVKFRPLDWEPQGQATVLFLPFAAISSAGKWRENSDGNDRTFLELQLNPETHEKLKGVIPEEEVSREYLKNLQKLPYLFMKMKTRSRLLLEWEGPKGCLAPPVDRIIAKITTQASVEGSG